MFFPPPWRTLAAALPALVLTFTPALHAAGAWSTNFEAAKAAAAKENKDILMDFTGSDWCEGCIHLEKEVFEKDSFQQEAPKHFVLLKLDYPQQKELPKDLQEQNDKLQGTYEIAGFPTILLTDAKGRPYAKTTYLEGGPEVYNKHLATLRKAHAARDEAFKKAEGASGADKAKALGDGLKAMDPEVVMIYYKAEVEEVIKLDTGDTLGYKAKQEFKAKRDELDSTLEELALNQKTKEFAAAIDSFIAKEKITGIDLQDLMLTKLQVLGPADLDKADALLDDVIKVDPKSELAGRAKSIKERVVEMRQQVEKSKKDPDAAGEEDPVVEDKDEPAKPETETEKK